MDRIGHIVFLGKVFKVLSESEEWPGYSCGISEQEFKSMREAISAAQIHNPWFTRQAIEHSLNAWADTLDEDSVRSWVSGYDGPNKPKRVAIIMAGNIPLVGLHDLLSVLISGHHAIVKTSQQDHTLIEMVLHILFRLSEEWKERIELVRGRLQGHDAVIATGSSNTGRYFEHYFGKVPNIIRKNRSSAAYLTGTESEEDLHRLGKDIFQYFGLGCRSVSKLFIPEEYDIDRFFKGIFEHHPIIEHSKYANNYDYHRALYLMNDDSFLDNGFLLVKEDSNLHSPVGTLHVQRYSSQEALREELESVGDELQCIIGQDDIPFGESQRPSLTDYADGVNTLDFLSAL